MAESEPHWSDNAYSIEEKYFHDLVRDWVISLLVFLVLLSASYGILLLFRREPDTDDFSASDKEDAAVYQAAFMICVFTLSAAFSCTLLLPASVASNEILLMYPDSYYLQWVNGSLITKLWDLTFYFSRALMFVFLPFTYLFTEAIGFVGMRHGLMARIYETVAVLCLVSFVLFGLFLLGMAMYYPYEDIILSDVWRLIDRLVTSVGFLFLLVATPIGYSVSFQATARSSMVFIQRRPVVSSAIQFEKLNANHISTSEKCDVLIMEKELLLRRRHVSSKNDIGNSSLDESRLDDINRGLKELERELEAKTGAIRSIANWLLDHSSVFQSLSPLLLACLVFCLAVLSALSTLFTVFERALTTKHITTLYGDENLRLGHESLSSLGIFGSTLGLILQLSCAIAALIGIYHLPVLKSIAPRFGDTPMTRLILNCTLWIFLAQAFPSFSSCLGLTNFQLLSGFRSSADWLIITSKFNGSNGWHGSAGQIFLTVSIDITYIAFVVLHLVNSLTAPLVRDFVAFIVTRWQKVRSRYYPHNQQQVAEHNIDAASSINASIHEATIITEPSAIDDSTINSSPAHLKDANTDCADLDPTILSSDNTSNVNSVVMAPVD